MTFSLHQRLEAGTRQIGEFSLSLVLLSRKANYPWCLLVPKRAGLTELHELSTEEQHQLIDESSRLSRAMVALFQPVSMNVASLGNSVTQLHLHHVARFSTDDAWPGPVWGAQPPKPYEEGAFEERMALLREALKGPGFKAGCY